jgi:hypothetical protein
MNCKGKTMKIDHINIAAPMDLLHRVRDFYCGALQLEEGPRPEFNISQVFCKDPCGNGVEANFASEDAD